MPALRHLVPAVLGLIPAAALAQPQPPLPAAEQAAILKAAGASQTGGKWLICAEDPQSSGAMIDQARDLNGDGRPEALVVEDGLFCNGSSGMRFSLVSKQANGQWRELFASSGVAEILATKGAGGWPDVSVGGPGFCFPVFRWNGTAYARHRLEYEGKPCRAAG